MEKKFWHISSKIRWDQESWVNKDKFILYSETVDSCSDSNKIKLIAGYLYMEMNHGVLDTFKSIEISLQNTYMDSILIKM